jgi:hypothetical protein
VPDERASLAETDRLLSAGDAGAKGCGEGNGAQEGENRFHAGVLASGVGLVNSAFALRPVALRCGAQRPAQA